jgi:hypothetical protein
MHASIPPFAWPTFDLEHALPPSKSSPRPVVAGAPHPQITTARSLTVQPAKPDRRRVTP